MAVTWADVVKVAPELSELSENQREAVLEDVALQLSESALGSVYDLASKFLAAHFGVMVLRGVDAPGGPLSAESVDGVSRSYSPGRIKDSDLESTSYGKRYKAVIRNLPYRTGFVL